VQVFESLENLYIRSLNLSVAPGLCYRGEAQLDANILAVPLEEPAFELSPIVRDDVVRDPEAAYNGLEECHCSPFGDVHHRSDFRPLGELVDGDVEEPVPADGPGKWSQDVHTPYSEWP